MTTTDTRSARATVVLVHGALTDASVWHPVMIRLQRRGHHVVAPPLPMRSLAGDSAAVRSVLDGLDGPVVAVGHSWAGSVLSDPAALTPAVRAVVFVAAFVQDGGETAGELNYRFPGSGLTPEATIVRATPDGDDLTLRPEDFARVYAGDVDPATATAMAYAQRGIAPGALGEIFTGTATWRTLPSWTLVATEDRSLPTQAQRFMAERAGATVEEVASSHAVPVAHPDATAALIEAAVSGIDERVGHVA